FTCLEVPSMNSTREQIQAEALSRAVGGQSLANWAPIIYGFTAKGIPESDIRPRENVFTYNAWRALGRQVRRGEHGVKVVTFVALDSATTAESDATDGDSKPSKRRSGARRPWTATVFHLSRPIRSRRSEQ